MGAINWGPGTAAALAALALIAAAAPAPWASAARAQPHTEPLRALLRHQGAAIDVIVREADEAGDEIRRGLRAEGMLHRPVYGRGGDALGELTDILVAEDGRVAALVVEVDGTPVRVPWRAVAAIEDGRIVANITGEEIEEAEEAADGEVEPGLLAFRVTELIGSYTLLEAGAAYGKVADVVFERDGEVTAVIVEPAYGYRERYGYLADDLPPYDYEAIGVQEYEEVEVDAATGELVIERETGGDKEQTGNLGGIRIDPADR